MSDEHQMKMEYRIATIKREAGTHRGGYYLLPRSEMRNKGETYQACDELVRRGEAKWLGLTSKYAPGIRLERSRL
jgi:hypothetical protein